MNLSERRSVPSEAEKELFNFWPGPRGAENFANRSDDLAEELARFNLLHALVLHDVVEELASGPQQQAYRSKPTQPNYRVHAIKFGVFCLQNQDFQTM